MELCLSFKSNTQFYFLACRCDLQCRHIMSWNNIVLAKGIKWLIKTCHFACRKAMFCSVKGMLLYVSVLSYADFNIMAFITSAAHSCCNVYVLVLMIRANIFLKETRHSSHCNLTCCRSARYSVMSCRPNSSHNMETADCVTSWKVNSSHRNALNVKLLHADVTRDEFL